MLRCCLRMSCCLPCACVIDNRASLTLFYAQFRFCADVFRTREIKSTTRCELKGEDCAAKGVMFAEISESAQKRFNIGISTYFSFAQLTGLPIPRTIMRYPHVQNNR